MWSQTDLGTNGTEGKGVRGTYAQADIFSSSLNGRQEPDRLVPC